MSTELSKIEYLRSKIVSLADHIRAKAGISDAMTFEQLEAAVDGITTGSSSGGGSGSGGGGNSDSGSDVGTTEITNGFTARFFDENNDIIQVTRVRNGLWLDKPQYECQSWRNANGYINSFPLLLESDIDFFATVNSTYADTIYLFMGVDKVEYPYLFIEYIRDSQPRIFFGKNYALKYSSSTGNAYVLFSGEVLYGYSTCTTLPDDYNDLTSMTQYFLSGISSSRLNEDNDKQSSSYISSAPALYSNFALHDEFTNDYSLDVVVEGE